jgi:hypothetical protein
MLLFLSLYVIIKLFSFNILPEMCILVLTKETVSLSLFDQLLIGLFLCINLIPELAVNFVH